MLRERIQQSNVGNTVDIEEDTEKKRERDRGKKGTGDEKIKKKRQQPQYVVEQMTRFFLIVYLARKNPREISSID